MERDRLEKLVKEWQDAHRALNEAIRAWVDAPMDLEIALHDRAKAADQALMEFVLYDCPDR